MVTNMVNLNVFASITHTNFVSEGQKKCHEEKNNSHYWKLI